MASAALKSAPATRSCSRALRITPDMLEAIVLSALTIAQVQPVQTAMPMAPVVPAMPQPPATGACTDSPRPVPLVLQPTVSRNRQVVRIHKVESTASLMPGEVIGYLYTLADGSSWLGQRTEPYMSGAAAAQVNQVLSFTHIPGQN